MPIASIDGISTRYEVIGSGPPLLLYAPGGFDATIEKWSALGIYARNRPLDALSRHFRCIVFDRRECGQSGGRIERITWAHYVAQGKGLLDHLGIERAHLMGGCMGCAPVTAFALAHPERVQRMVLFWPVGGARYRIASHQRFAEHLAFVQQHGLAGVVAHATGEQKPFSADPRGGPWASLLQRDAAFAAAFARLDREAYTLVCIGMARSLFDRDTAPGGEPEDLMRCTVPALIVPGNDAAHATSAARYLHECLPQSEYWDVPVAQQTAEPTNARLVAFLTQPDAT